MKKTATLIIFFQLLCSNVFAQKQIELSLGAGHLMRQDLTLSPFIDNAISPINAGLAFDWKVKNLNRVEVRFGQYKTPAKDEYNYISEFDTFTHTANRHQFTRLELNYQYLIDQNHKGKTDWGFGLASRNRLIAGLHHFGVYDGLFSYNFSFGIDGVGFIKHPINENNSIQAKVSLPVFAFSARNPYMIQDSKWMEDNMSGSDIKAVANMISNSTLRSWNSYRTFDFQLQWKNQINEKWALGARYAFGAINNTKPNPYTSFENILHFNIHRTL